MDELIKKISDDFFIKDEDGVLKLSYFGMLSTFFIGVGLFIYLIKGSENNESIIFD